MRRMTFMQDKLQCKPHKFFSHPVLEVSASILILLRSAEQSHLDAAEKILVRIAVSSGQQKHKLDFIALYQLLKHVVVPFQFNSFKGRVLTYSIQCETYLFVHFNLNYKFVTDNKFVRTLGLTFAVHLRSCDHPSLIFLIFLVIQIKFLWGTLKYFTFI